jgi:hypothetical protein
MDKQQMNRVGAVRAFFNKDASRPVEMKEMGAFWSNCTQSEKIEFAQMAADQLGVELQEQPVG